MCVLEHQLRPVWTSSGEVYLNIYTEKLLLNKTSRSKVQVSYSLKVVTATENKLNTQKPYHHLHKDDKLS